MRAAKIPSEPSNETGSLAPKQIAVSRFRLFSDRPRPAGRIRKKSGTIIGHFERREIDCSTADSATEMR